jgi:preprotein translocase subunit SecG
MGGCGVMSGRASATPLGKVTWGLAIAFIATSMTLTILAAASSENASVVDRLQDVPRAPATAPGALPSAEELLPPSLGGSGNAPLVPQAAD